MRKHKKRRIRRFLLIGIVCILFFYWLQNYGVHFDRRFCVDDTDVMCVSVLGWFTKSDRVDEKDSEPIRDLQPGDILLSLSTHSMGWRHGHAGLVVDSDSVLECRVLGKNSDIVNVKEWQRYSNYIVLRVKNVTDEEQEAVVSYAKEYLTDIPYRLTAGLFGEKAPDCLEKDFGLQCAYLVWYAWQEFGYDLDSDGGKLVTVDDILNSKIVEVIQVYGIDLK